jgi:hypothetical protein
MLECLVQLLEWARYYDCVLGMMAFSDGISLTFCDRRTIELGKETVTLTSTDLSQFLLP